MNLDDHGFKGLKFHELIAAIDHTTSCFSDKVTTKVGLSQDFLLTGCWEESCDHMSNMVFLAPKTTFIYRYLSTAFRKLKS